jgi:hypothetical protein
MLTSFSGRAKIRLMKPAVTATAKKAADGDARDDLGDQRADLDADQGTEQHAHGQGVEDKAEDGVLREGAVAGGEDDLEDIGAHRGHGRDAEAVDEDREGQEAAADAHDGRGEADDKPLDNQEPSRRCDGPRG